MTLHPVMTRELLLERAGFDAEKYVKHALRRTREALSAEKFGEPDHAIRLKAAERIFELAGVSKPSESAADPSKPVSVTIVLAQPGNGHHPGTEIPSHGVRLHLSRGDGGA